MLKAWRIFFLFWLCAFSGLAVARAGYRIPRIPHTGFVLDEAGMLAPQTIQKINDISDRAKRDLHAPIYVVTIETLSSVRAYSVEEYAPQLFNTWGIGDREVNRGILLLVARSDRKARIELGAGWGRAQDGNCQEIMSSWIIPRFKEENYSAGVLNGVEALDRLARTGRVPSPPLEPWVLPAIGIGGFLLVWFFIDLFRYPGEGWAYQVVDFFRSPSSNSYNSRTYYNSDSGGGWGGGSSGGGFSGGGGASGSW